MLCDDSRARATRGVSHSDATVPRPSTPPGRRDRSGTGQGPSGHPGVAVRPDDDDDVDGIGVRPVARPSGRIRTVARYKLVYRDDEGDHEVTETLDDVDDVQREDGIVSFWRGNDAFLRVHERHVVTLEEV
jgi:hypothetical protein